MWLLAGFMASSVCLLFTSFFLPFSFETGSFYVTLVVLELTVGTRRAFLEEERKLKRVLQAKCLCSQEAFLLLYPGIPPFSGLQNKFLARYVSLPNQNKIWTVTVSPEQKDRTPLVMVHGFGGGVGLWILNMDSLSARRTLHTFDLLGFGRSSRPTFPRDPEGAEDEFVTSIETWRETMGIPTMILLGHSLGGFLATSYSIKYPER